MEKQAASPEQLEREIVDTRAAIDHKLALLQHRLAPRRVAGQMVDALGTQGGVFARNLAVTMRDNPVPVLLLAVGIGWLMIAGRGGRHAAGSARALPEPATPQPTSEPATSEPAALEPAEPAAAPRAAAALAAAESERQRLAAGRR